jgi:hypothetical protein
MEGAFLSYKVILLKSECFLDMPNATSCLSFLSQNPCHFDLAFVTVTLVVTLVFTDAPSPAGRWHFERGRMAEHPVSCVKLLFWTLLIV